jgi:hypothetical protein
VTILDEILEHKRGELERARRRVTPDVLAARARDAVDAPRGLRAALA